MTPEHLRLAAAYIRRAADGESDHYRRWSIYNSETDQFDEGEGPSGEELAEGLEALAQKLESEAT